MSAIAALHAAHQAGVTVIVDGDKLRLEASAQPSSVILDELRRNKPDILKVLRSPRHALIDYLVPAWLNQNPAPSPPGRCAWCGEPESVLVVVLPFGTAYGMLVRVVSITQKKGPRPP